MKKFTKTVATLLIAMGVFTSCDQNLTEELIASEESTEISNEEIKSAVETLSFKYSITAINDNDTEVIVSSDEELTSYGERNRKIRIVFPIDITVDSETITVNNKEEMKALVGKKKSNHRKQPFELVFPVTVTTADGDLVLEDKAAFKGYRETLEEKTRPTFVFPISVVFEEETIVINSEEELKALNPKKGDRPARPELVFPVSVLAADGDLIIEDKEAFKVYRNSLKKGTHPEFVFPISLIIDEETVVVNNEDELKALMPKRGHKPARPELVFPVSVVTEDGNLEIADQEAMKTYASSLEEGIRPIFVFPISFIIKGETVVVNSVEELKALKSKKRERK